MCSLAVSNLWRWRTTSTLSTRARSASGTGRAEPFDEIEREGRARKIRAQPGSARAAATAKVVSMFDRRGHALKRSRGGHAERVTACGFDARWHSLELLRNSQAPQAEPSNEPSFGDFL
jgi:hypothetical protein